MAANEPILIVIIYGNGDASVEHSMQRSFDDIYYAHIHARDIIQKRLDKSKNCPAHPENANATRH